MEMSKKPCCPIIDIDGFIENGKQFDLEVNLPEDNRDVVFGVVKNSVQEPVKDAVVKLIEVVYDCGKEERRPVTHTFTNSDGISTKTSKSRSLWSSLPRKRICFRNFC